MPGGLAPTRAPRGATDALARLDVHVLLVGVPARTEELARALHARSARRDGPLVLADIAGIPERLQDAELFGHIQGAEVPPWNWYTPRLLAAANGGTLLVTHASQLSVALQAKLADAVRTGRFTVAGRPDAPERSDARLVLTDPDGTGIAPGLRALIGDNVVELPTPRDPRP